jgi:hypothetical protein
LNALQTAVVLSGNMSFSHEYQFIDGQDKNARKKTRAHVTREYYRERRWQQINPLKSSDEPDVSREPPNRPFVVLVTKLGPGSTEALNVERRKGGYDRRKTGGTRCPPSKLSSKPDSSMEDVQETASEALVKASPVTMLGAGRVDPFQTFPIEATRDIHQFVDHCRRYQPRWPWSLPR